VRRRAARARLVVRASQEWPAGEGERRAGERESPGLWVSRRAGRAAGSGWRVEPRGSFWCGRPGQSSLPRFLTSGGSCGRPTFWLAGLTARYKPCSRWRSSPGNPPIGRHRPIQATVAGATETPDPEDRLSTPRPQKAPGRSDTGGRIGPGAAVRRGRAGEPGGAATMRARIETGAASRTEGAASRPGGVRPGPRQQPGPRGRRERDGERVSLLEALLRSVTAKVARGSSCLKSPICCSDC